MKTQPYNKLKEHYPFDSSMLKVGEMMELSCDNHIILRTYGEVVDLNDPRKTWNIGVKLQGRKLLPGEGITLIQE
jgi:hypothetical protein